MQGYINKICEREAESEKCKDGGGLPSGLLSNCSFVARSEWVDSIRKNCVLRLLYYDIRPSRHIFVQAYDSDSKREGEDKKVCCQLHSSHFWLKVFCACNSSGMAVWMPPSRSSSTLTTSARDFFILPSLKILRFLTAVFFSACRAPGDVSYVLHRAVLVRGVLSEHIIHIHPQLEQALPELRRALHRCSMIRGQMFFLTANLR